MRHTDIAIVGGGLAGSIAAAMLGRAGIDAILIDPHRVYPPDFRCEKLDADQMRVLQKTGLAEFILPVTTANTGMWAARMGRLLDKRPNNQRDIMYDTLVNAARSAIPESTPFLTEKVSALQANADRQIIALSNGEEISARLIVLATGLNNALRQSLGIEREVLSACHSVSIGFDMVPVGRPRFAFPALDYYAERPSDRLAYLTLFPMGSVMRANFFTYRDAHDPWLKRMRSETNDAVFEVLPNLRKIVGDFAVVGDVKIRPVDLMRVKNFRRSGVVVVGDAFATSCPAAGTGTDKVFTDVERLCNHYIPLWLKTPGMATAKISAF